MSSVASRLMLPTIISIAGVVITQMWYLKVSKITFVKSSGVPIAILQQRNDRVERRPTTRLIWQDVDQGEQLYSGEAVRTTSSASGQIQFIQSGVTVGLEPDSVVIIEETNGNVALNLVNGGVFVKNDGPVEASKSKTSAGQPTIKAGSKTISLTDKKSELNLSLSDSGQASLVVSKGNVAVTGAAGTQRETVKAGDSKALATTVNAPAAITILSPKPNTVLPISSKSSAMIIQWQPLSPAVTITLEMGSTRDKLNVVASAFAGNGGRATIQAKPGGFFWRLIARDKAGKVSAQSPTMYNEGLALEVPRLLSNANGEHIFGAEADGAVAAKLSWSRPQGSESTILNVARDKDFKTILENKVFATGSEWVFTAKEPGTFYWRISAAWRGVDVSLTSQVGSFVVERQQELPIPNPESPKDNSKFTKPEIATSGIILVWSPLEGIPEYLVSISQQQADNSWREVKTAETTVAQYRLSNVPAGTWRWSVKSKNKNRLSKLSSFQSFKVLDVARLDTSSITTAPQIVASGNTLNLVVGSIPKTTARLRFRLVDNTSSLDKAPWLQGLSTGQLIAKVKALGKFQLQVEALDKNDQVVAVSDVVTFEAKLPDLLAAPELTGKATQIKANDSGNANISWTPVKGAASYVLSLNGPKPMKFRVNRSTQLAVPGLLPGSYKLIVTAVDALGRPGDASKEFSVIVPRTNNLEAPKAKSIKIRD